MRGKRFRLGKFWLERRACSPNWYIAWIEGGSKRRLSTGTGDPDAAQVSLAQHFVAHAELRDERADQTPVGVVLDRYQHHHGSKIASRVTQRVAVERWKAWWGARTVAEVTVTEQERFVASLRAEGLSDGYVKRVLAVGKAALNRAWKRGEVQQVPFIHMVADAEPYPHRASNEQLAAFLNAIEPPHLWLYCLIRLNTLCRGDAARELQPFQIDFDAGLVHLNPVGRKQTKKRRPVVPLTDTLRKALQASVGSPYVNWHGKPVQSVRRAWADARAAAGLPAWFVPKVLRHTAAVHLRRSGIEGWDVSGMLGHRGSNPTTEVYARFDPAYLRRARRALDVWMIELAALVPRLKGVTQGSAAYNSPNEGKEKCYGINRMLVGATGIEPVTPTMSRSRSTRKISD